jgi:hypothetical protein
MLMGHPSQTDCYLDTQCTPKHNANYRPRQKRQMRRLRALDKLES